MILLKRKKMPSTDNIAMRKRVNEDARLNMNNKLSNLPLCKDKLKHGRITFSFFAILYLR